MSIDSKQLAELRAIAAAATQPSPWERVQEGRERFLVLDSNGLWVADCGIGPDEAAHIAAFHPERVMALIDTITALEREAKHHRDEILRLDLALAKERAKIADVAKTKVA